MKYCNIALYAFIICFSAYAFAQKFDPPLERVLKKELDLTLKKFEEQCAAQGHSIRKKFHKSRTSAAEIGNDLADDLVNRANKLGKVDAEKWIALNKDRCLTNVVLKHFTVLSVDNIVIPCLDEKNRLEGDTKTQFTKALFKEYCASVKKLAKQKYQKNKN